MKKRRIILGVIVLVVILIIVGRIITSKKGAKRVSIEEGIPVEVVEVVKGDLKEIVSYTGDIKAKERIEVYPRVSGKIIKKNVVEGDRIKRGQTIALIDRDEPGFKFEPAPVDSLIGGTVGRVYVDLGAKVTLQTPVALVVDMDRVKVKIDVVERDLPKIKIGQEAQIRVDAYPERDFTGKVWKISPVVDLASRTAPVEILVSNLKHLLKPGMFARIKILIRERKGILIIPRDAIIREDSSNYVFVVKDKNKVHRKKIEVGLHKNNKFEVINGLDESELVVTMGNTRLKEGNLIEVIR